MDGGLTLTSAAIAAVPAPFPSESCGFKNPSSHNVVGIGPQDNLFNTAVALRTDVAMKGTLLDAG
jgi:hypothetical protein